MEKQVILRASSLKKSFYHPRQTVILNGIDLQVAKGETVAIEGRSGEGKSTLLQILGTLDTPCSGSVTIANQPASGFNKAVIRNKHVAFIFQTFHLLEDYTTLENVLMPAAIAREPIKHGNIAYKRAVQLVEHVGLGHRIYHSTKLLSGGEKQRVAIARAFCNNPDLILADEPTGNLDRETAGPIHQMLIDYAMAQGHALVVVTHDPSLASLCQTRYRLEEGVLTPRNS